MQYIIKEYTDYSEQEIISLYTSVGWLNYIKNPKMLKDAYEHSLKIYAAYADDILVGLVRVVGDGFSVILIQDLIVEPTYQRNGIGKALLQYVLSEYKDVYQKLLLTDYSEKKTGFYQSIGFTMDTDIGCRAFTKFY